MTPAVLVAPVAAPGPGEVALELGNQMWRRFIAEITITAALVTILVSFAVTKLGGGAAARPVAGADADDRTCWDAQLRVEPYIQSHGHGQLCLDHQVVVVALDVEDLTPGDLYEGWLVYVDAPGTCSSTPCPLSLLLHGEPTSIFNRLGVATAGDTRRAHFTGTFRGLTLTQGSQLQVLLISHGAAIVGAGHIHQLLGTSWPPNSDDPGTGVVIARTHFTVN